MARVSQAHLEARRHQILDAAWSCFARQGYHRATMQDIATEAGLSAGGIYRYFDSKEAVLRAIVDRNTNRFTQLVRDVRAELASPVDALRAIGQAMFLQPQDPLLDIHIRLDVELRGEALRNDGLREAFRQQLVFWRTAMTDVLREAQRAGQLRPEVDPEALIVLGMCAYEGLRQWKLLDPEMFRPAEVYRLIMMLATPEGGAVALETRSRPAKGGASVSPVTAPPPGDYQNPET